MVLSMIKLFVFYNENTKFTAAAVSGSEIFLFVVCAMHVSYR